MIEANLLLLVCLDVNIPIKHLCLEMISRTFHINRTLFDTNSDLDTGRGFLAPAARTVGNGTAHL